jgi:hypothetical protein
VKRSFDGPYRAGPWPGLTPTGAGLVLALAAFLWIGQALVGPPRRPLPDLVAIGVTALLPLAIAERLVRMPGVACAVCGAYLLPASLISLLNPSLEPPPLLLIPAFGFELALWLHLSRVADLWPWRKPSWLTSAQESEPLTRSRAILGGAVFGLLLALVEPPYRILLGANPADWTGPPVWAAAVACTVVCGALATILNARGRAS